MSELVIVACAPREARCDTHAALSAEREGLVRARFDEARALLEPAGLWVQAPVVALDARLGGAVATTFADAGREGLSEYPGRPVVYFDASLGAVPDLDVVLHELTHIWLRAAGAGDARWRFERSRDREAGRANHESAIVHEGLADFVAAALTGDPVIGEGLGERFMPTSLRVEARCPDGLTGSPREDSLVVSGALWELGLQGRDPAAMAEVLAAVRASAVEGSRGVAQLSDALGEALSRRATAGGAEALSARWAMLVERRGLQRCREPLELGAGPVSARAGDFIAAGTERFIVAGATDGADRAGGPLSFTARVHGADAVRVLVRSSESGALTVAWRTFDAGGELLGSGLTPLGGAPSSWAPVSLPRGSHTLDFELAARTSRDIAYNDVRVTREMRAPSEVPAPGGSGCDLGGLSAGLGLALGVAFAARRWRRA